MRMNLKNTSSSKGLGIGEHEGYLVAVEFGVCLCRGALVYHVGAFFFFSSRRRHTRFDCDWSSDVCSSDLSDLLPVATSIQPNLLDSAISRTPRARAWMFSSVRSGSLPLNGSASASLNS